MCYPPGYDLRVQHVQEQPDVGPKFAMIPASKDTPPTFYNLEEGPVWQMEDREYTIDFCSFQGSAQPQPDDRIDAHSVA